MANVKVSSVIKINASMLNALDRAQYEALSLTADALLTDIRDAEVMPFGDGTLQNDSTFIDDSQRQQGRVSIVSSTPYARRLYYHPEYNFRRNNNANAGGKWFESYISGDNRQKPAEFYREMLKRRGGF